MTTLHRMRRCLVASLLMIALLPIIGATLVLARDLSAKYEVSIGTGNALGVYFPVGSAICRLVHRDRLNDYGGEESDLPCSAPATGGSNANIDALRSQQRNFGIVQSDTLFHAVEGQRRFQERKFDTVRSVLSLHAEPFQFLIARNLGAIGIADLKGRKINGGAIGSTQREITMAVMQQHGLDEKALSRVTELSTSEQFQAFCDGDIEGFGMLIGYPNVGYASAIQHCKGTFLDVASDPIKTMIKAAPYYAAVTIPRGIYPGIERDIQTFGVLAVLATTSEVAEDMVYSVTRAVFERLDALRAMHPALAGLSPERMIRDGISAPLHPGAIKYYRERGWM